MKTIHILVLIGVLIFSSCSDLDEINENHNYPSNVPPQLLLTNIQKEAFKVEGLNPLYAMRMAILTSEENSYQYYKWGAGSFDDYTNLLQVTKMIEEANRINNPNYLAVGKFFRAFYFYKLTLTFGDIPYTEALAGESQGIFTPKYDTQQSVLEGILKELEEANNLLNTSGSLSGDIIYNGNLLKWKKLINSFRLKILLSLSQKTTVGSINIIQEFNKITNSQPLISTNEDNAQLVFYDQAGSRYTQFNSSSYASSLYLSDYFINLFKNRNDPRIFSFAQQTVGASENGLSITDFNAYNGGNPIVPYAENEKLVRLKIYPKLTIDFI